MRKLTKEEIEKAAGGVGDENGGTDCSGGDGGPSSGSGDAGRGGDGGDCNNDGNDTNN